MSERDGTLRNKGLVSIHAKDLETIRKIIIGELKPTESIAIILSPSLGSKPPHDLPQLAIAYTMRMKKNLKSE